MRNEITPKNDFQNNNQPIKSNPSNQLSTIQFILKVSAVIFDCSRAYRVRGFWKSLSHPLPSKSFHRSRKKIHVMFLMHATMVVTTTKAAFHCLQLM